MSAYDSVFLRNLKAKLENEIAEITETMVTTPFFGDASVVAQNYIMRAERIRAFQYVFALCEDTEREMMGRGNEGKNP
jgi:hypothetical protein